MAESETLAMSRRSRALKAQGIDVINLSLGEPDFDTPDFIKDAAKKAIDDNYSHYTPVAGYEDVLKAICHKFERDNGLHFKPSQIVVSNGAKQTIANLAFAMLDEGDEAIIAAPYWVSYREIIKLAGGVPVPLEAGIAQNFKFTAQQLAAAITPRTKMLIFSSPCNPTGSIFSPDELEAIAKVVKQHPQLLVVADEIYELIYFNQKPTSLGALPGMQDQVVTVNGLSKGFAMTGWRLGYMGGPEHVAQACIKIQGQFTSAANSIAQRATITALTELPERVAYMQEAFQKRRDLTFALLSEIPDIELNIPDGAFYFFPNMHAYLGKKFEDTTLHTTDDLCMYLLNHAHVAIVPGEAFGAPGYVRIAYATSENLIKTAVERIKKALNALQ